VSAAADQPPPEIAAAGADSDAAHSGQLHRVVQVLRTRAAARGGLVAVATLQGLLLAYFAPLKTLLQGVPLIAADYSLHYYQVRRAIAAFEQSGELWGYDPLVLAGQPAGIIEDLTSKGTELAVIAMGGLGVAPGLAYNLLVLSTWLAVPWLGFLAARLFELSRWQAVAAALLWVLLWSFDSLLHWSWFIGMFSWTFASCLAIVLLGLLHQTLSRGRSLAMFLPVALVASVIAIAHPFAVISVAPACIALYAQRFRELSRAQHGLLWGAALLAAMTCLVWIFPTLRFSHYIGDVDTFFNAKLQFLFFDFFDILHDPMETGQPVRTMFRMICFAGAAVMLLAWFREKDRRALPLAVLLVSTILCAYLASYTWIGRQTQPYRQLVPAMLAAAIPTAALISRLAAGRFPPRLSWRGATFALLAAVIILPRIGQSIAFYMPDLLPTRYTFIEGEVQEPALVGVNEPKPDRYALLPVTKTYADMKSWFEENHQGRGRIVVQEWPLGEYLAADSELPILGGFVQRPIPHADAHLFGLQHDGYLPGAELADYVKRYAVGWFVIYTHPQPLHNRNDLFEFAAVIEDMVIYRVRHEPSYFMRGSGTIESAALNSIKVNDAVGDDIVLRFHWMESLRCRPDCTVEVESIANDRVGFVRVKNPPSSFEIYNDYN
jgi:hypothetical protein